LQLIDQHVLLRFVMWMDYFIFCSTILSSFLQIYVLQQANRHIRRGASDQCLHPLFLHKNNLFSFRYSSYVTRRRGISLALLVWACCVIFVSGAWYFECFKCEDNCSRIYLLRERWGMYLLFSVILEKTRTCALSEQAIYQTGQSRQVLVSRLRTFYFVFMTTVFTAATLLPFRISSIIMSFSDHHEVCTLLIILYTALCCTLYFNAVSDKTF
uniref:G protein-coupled receptor n=1 Tax=Haemonchus placei TaxID=6290 RepID=A0A0N4XAU1_HAEPC